ncbi:MAG TPA: hypothetical protein VGH30_03265 [Jatrophihabitantaceae bacterium]|jgi:hypothetical protein
MTRPHLVLQLGASHDSIDMLREALTGLRPQLRAHGVSFAALGRDDPAHTLPGLLDEERTHAHAARHQVCPTLISCLLSGPEASPAGDPSVSGPYPDAVTVTRRVIEATGSSQVLVLLHIQRQDRLMERAYLDAVLAGGSHEFADQFPQRQDTSLDFGPLVKQLREVPAVLEVRVRPVELALADPLGFVDDVLEAIGLSGELDLSAVPAAVPATRRLSARGARIAAAMNAHLDDDAERADVHEFLLEHFGVTAARAANVRGILSDDERARIVQTYAQVNHALFAEHLRDLPADSYGDEEPMVAPASGSGYATSADRPAVRRSNSS